MRRKIKSVCILFMMLLLTGCGRIGDYAEPFIEKIVDSDEEPVKQLEKITLEEMEETLQAFITDSEEERVNFEITDHDTYAYDRLSVGEKIWYADINENLSVRSDTPVKLSEEGFEQGLTAEDVGRIYQCVMIDHPEYFYVEGYEYTQYSALGEVIGIEICGTYNTSLEECISKKAQIDAAVNGILSGISVEATDYEKIKYVYETIIFNTDYCMDASDNQNIYSVFVGHASVCQGYAKATQYLLNRLGIACTIVFGEVENGEGHSWNLVKADGEYYYLDTTWGDASYMAGIPGQETIAPEINYDYLCITTKQLLRTHDMKHHIELPLCDADMNNYYVKEGCYFHVYDEEQIKREFEEAFFESKDFVTLKSDDQEVFEIMCRELIENQKVFDYLNDSYETINYVVSEEQLSLTFWVTK